MTHTEQLRLYKVKVTELQNLLIESKIMDLLMQLMLLDFDNEDLGCIPYYSISIVFHIVDNKDRVGQVPTLDNPQNKAGVKAFLDCKLNDNFFLVPQKKNMIEIIRSIFIFYFLFYFLFFLF
jgi:hypothetical protein